MKRILFFATLAFVLFSCDRKVGEKKDNSLMVSILPLKYFAERIAGPEFTVEALVPPGAGPETYEPSPKDLAKLSDASLFFHTGYLEFEQVLVQKLEKQSDRFVNLSTGVNLIRESHEHEGHQHLDGTDPHYWVSVSEARVFSTTLLNALVKRFPAKAATFRANHAELSSRLDSLDQWIHTQLDSCKHRIFIIYHPGMTYYARDYGLEQLSVEMEGKQPSTAHIRELVDYIREHKVKSLFVQQQFDSQVMNSLAGETGAQIVSIDHLSADWLENMKTMTGLIKAALHE